MNPHRHNDDVLALMLFAVSAQPLLNGADASFVPQYRDLKAEFFVGATKTDGLDALAQSGSKLLRLRVWLNPKDGYCSVDRTLALARDGKKLGMHLLINFHYADDWADPQKQPTPDAWRSLNLTDLAKAVKAHTQDTLDRLAAQGTPADSVQVGNEIRNGILWPMGKRSEGKLDKLAVLLKAGVEGVRASKNGKKIKVMIHHDQGGMVKECRFFFGELKRLGVRFDWIGLSYYPWWHGTMPQLQENMNGLAAEFRKPVMIVETAYPFTLGWKDQTGNFCGSESQLVPGFPATPEGQAKFLRELNRMVRAIPGKRGLGVVYWAPEYVAHPGIQTPCENLCLFDFENKLLPGAYALGE